MCFDLVVYGRLFDFVVRLICLVCIGFVLLGGRLIVLIYAYFNGLLCICFLFNCFVCFCCCWLLIVGLLLLVSLLLGIDLECFCCLFG